MRLSLVDIMYTNIEDVADIGANISGKPNNIENNAPIKAQEMAPAIVLARPHFAAGIETKIAIRLLAMKLINVYI